MTQLFMQYLFCVVYLLQNKFYLSRSLRLDDLVTENPNKDCDNCNNMITANIKYEYQQTEN